MHQKYRNKNTLKNLPFYSEEIKSYKKRTEKLAILSFDLKYRFSIKNLKN